VQVHSPNWSNRTGQTVPTWIRAAPRPAARGTSVQPKAIYTSPNPGFTPALQRRQGRRSDPRRTPTAQLPSASRSAAQWAVRDATPPHTHFPPTAHCRLSSSLAQSRRHGGERCPQHGRRIITSLREEERRRRRGRRSPRQESSDRSSSAPLFPDPRPCGGMVELKSAAAAHYSR
jgi:hypothetical protein